MTPSQSPSQITRPHSSDAVTAKLTVMRIRAFLSEIKKCKERATGEYEGITQLNSDGNTVRLAEHLKLKGTPQQRLDHYLLLSKLVRSYLDNSKYDINRGGRPDDAEGFISAVQADFSSLINQFSTNELEDISRTLNSIEAGVKMRRVETSYLLSA